ncbi:MAG: hypothetical protein ACRELF_16205 [Gemmataceae bacterium]
MNDRDAKEVNLDIGTKDSAVLREKNPKEETQASAWLWESYSPDTLAVLLDP